ncbi:hypothetical protein PV326_003305 [Microctonus aethiopoides]|nr:hypothetical protein PV326_003305 [Microctonus aethiopoides]
MENISVSKGIFPMRGNYFIGGKGKRVKNKFFTNELSYKAYKKAWSVIENVAEEINVNMFKQILSDLQNYIGNIRDNIRDEITNEIPTAILLTGINLPDHDVLFRKLTSKLSSITRHIAVIQSRDSSNMKNLIEETVFQLINNSNEESINIDVRKSHCTFRLLEAWYFEKCDINTPLVIIIPDFESFNATILRDFILVLSCYAKTMKFVLVFGVATTLHAIHRSLSYDVTSKLRVQVFHTPTQMKSLSDVLEGTVLSGKTPFKLTGSAFKLLTDIFLFYDFSVDNFLQGFKICMDLHFHGNNYTALCCERENIPEQIDKLTIDDLNELKKLPSINNYLRKIFNDKWENIDNEEFKNIIIKLLNDYHDSMSGFYPILKCFHYLTYSLPGAPMGKEIKKLLEIIKESENNILHNVQSDLTNHLKIIRDASLETITDKSEAIEFNPKGTRRQFHDQLKKMSQKQVTSPFKEAQTNLLNYLDKIFRQFLINPNRLPASEIFCFSDAYTTKHHLRGSLRSVIHTGLNDPQIYLKCDCCKLEKEETIQPTLPDLSIIYKLHLESKKLINMYDWLQAFLTIVEPNNDPNSEREIDPKMQARFTQAVAELQFLGFIKTSRKKTDHVKRLT